MSTCPNLSPASATRARQSAFFRHVGGEENRLGAHIVQRLQCRCRLVLIASGDHDPGAAGGDTLGHAKPDATVAAGDNRNLSL